MLSSLYVMLGMEGLSSERVVCLASLMIMSISGLTVIAITSYNKVSTSHIQLALTRSLWKFESEDNKKTIYAEKCWSWRKLLFAGLMLSSLVASLAIKIVNRDNTLWISFGLFAVWMIGILWYWYYLVEPAFHC